AFQFTVRIRDTLCFRQFGPWNPNDLATKSVLEMTNRFHRHGIHKLLMKLRISFAWRQTLLRSDSFVRQIDGFVPTTARRIEIDHFYVFADRTGLKLSVLLCRSLLQGFEG